MIELSPIFWREARGRWRGWRAFGVLFLYALALCWVLAWNYATSSASTELSSSSTATQGGRLLFRALQNLQMMAWLLIVPILTATAVSAERERGLLEALQLSGLPAWRVVAGKLAAVLSFVLLMMLASAPVLSVCLILGGVAPEEGLRALALQAATIMMCAALGLWISARARRNLDAVRNGVIAMLGFVAVTWLAFPLMEALPWEYFSLEPDPVMSEILLALASSLLLLNPLRAQHNVFEGMKEAYPEFAGPFASWIPDNPYGFTMGALCLLTLLFLWGAARAAGRVFPDPQWLERKRYLSFAKGRFVWREAADDGRTAVSKADAQAAARAVFDTPLAAFVNFSNPVMQREVRGRLRLRRYPKIVTVLMSLLAAFGGVSYLWGIFEAWTDPAAQRDILGGCLFLLLLGITFAMPLMGAGALVRERENGTWEMLELSLMKPSLLLTGKIGAPLFFALCSALLLLPIALPCVFSSSLVLAFCALLLLAATAFCYTAWGLWISWHARSAVTGMALTLISLLVILLVMPFLIEIATRDDYGRSHALESYTFWWHPWVAIGEMTTPNNAPGFGLITAIFLFFSGLMLLCDVHRRIRKAWRLPRKACTAAAATPAEAHA